MFFEPFWDFIHPSHPPKSVVPPVDLRPQSISERPWTCMEGLRGSELSSTCGIFWNAHGRWAKRLPPRAPFAAEVQRNLLALGIVATRADNLYSVPSDALKTERLLNACCTQVLFCVALFTGGLIFEAVLNTAI